MEDFLDVMYGRRSIREFDDQAVDDLEALTVYLETEAAVGETVVLTVLRDGTQLTIPVTLGEDPQV